MSHDHAGAGVNDGLGSRIEEDKFDSAWALTAHRVRMLIGERCAYVLAFYEGNTIFDFD